MKKATIDDVAELANVSIKTVSRVLNHEPKVRPATQERVREAMTVLDYSPNSSARRLAGNRSYLLGLLYDNPGNNYITGIQHGALEACRQDHYDIMIYPCRYTDPTLADQISDLFASVRVDGVLLTPPICDVKSVREKLEQLDAPSVVISQGVENGSNWSVGTNDRQVCAQMVHHLADLGHTRIAFVKGDPDHHAIENRFRGFLDGMRERGIEVDPELCLQGDNAYESGLECGRRLLENSRPPTAVFCANDDMAAGVMNIAHERGLSIPADLSVSGFDDVPLAQQTWPPLTTVRQPLHELSLTAARLLIDRIRGLSPDNKNHILESVLVVRQSTGPAPSSNS